MEGACVEKAWVEGRGWRRRRNEDRGARARSPGAAVLRSEPAGVSEPTWIGRSYFLWRARLSSFRCLCFRIFLRRFLITLPTGSLRTPGRAGGRIGSDVAHMAPGEPMSRKAGLERDEV